MTGPRATLIRMASGFMALSALPSIIPRVFRVRGTVNTDVDLGYGYLYKVLLEEASFTPGLE